MVQPVSTKQNNTQQIANRVHISRKAHIALLGCHNEGDGVSNHQRLVCFLNRLSRFRSKKTSKLRVTGYCERNPSVTGGFPSQRASNAENVSIWCRHHGESQTISMIQFREGTGHKMIIPRCILCELWSHRYHDSGVYVAQSTLILVVDTKAPATKIALRSSTFSLAKFNRPIKMASVVISWHRYIYVRYVHPIY